MLWHYLAWIVMVALAVIGTFALARYLDKVEPYEPGVEYEEREPFGGELR